MIKRINYQPQHPEPFKKKYDKYFSIGIFVYLLFLPVSYLYAALSCSVITQAACGSGTVLLRMSGSTNAHAELPSQVNANYDTNVVCCTSTSSIGNVCSGNFKSIARISGVTNGTTQQSSVNTYGTNVCLSDVTSGDTVTTGYQNTNCTGYDTTMFSLSSASNAHVGNGSAYTIKACATIFTPSITFSISTNSIDFGTLSSSSSRYATVSGGSGTEVQAHTIAASTNASSGYVITVNGTTLTSGVNTITAIGATNTAPSIGTKQFGLRMVATGTGVVTSPYAASGFAYNIGALPSQVASGAGDGTSTSYSVRYMANITTLTQAGSYKANVNYSITGTF